MTTIKERPNWSELLKEAITKPGTISEAYSLFHSYSFGNAMWVMAQCRSREIVPGPIATFKKWKQVERSVSKGQKALWMWLPITTKKTDPVTGEEKTGMFFVTKKRWFVLSQTEGKDYAEDMDIPNWNKEVALKALKVEEIKFDYPDGNVLGYARKNTVSVSPLGVHPERTLFHELAHVILGHTKEGDVVDSANTPRSIREVEAEAVAYLMCSTLDVDSEGKEYSRGYIQTWLKNEKIDQRCAGRIFSATEKILKAGRPKKETKKSK